MPITAFLADVSILLKTGSATEHSYRSALGTLFKAVLKADAINEPKHEIHGAPDFVINRGSAPIGHVEAKDVGIRLAITINDSELAKPKTQNGRQLQRYRAALPNLLYTDGLVWYWFVQGQLRHENPIVVATWNNKTKKLTPTPTGIVDLEQLLIQFGNQDTTTVTKPRDLAQRLARIAHWLRDVIVEVFESQTSQGALHQQLEAFRKTLLPGLPSSEFADMYAQTIVYGLFAARVSQPTKSTFTRLDAAQSIPKTNPFLRSLFQQIAGFDLDDRIAWLVDDCASLLAHTDMSEVMRDFGKATRQEDPVVHFYETFLAAYDPNIREKRGVYYTPEPVVDFIVRSVHSILQTNFNKPMGLADEKTIILDPATGTATFLNTVVQHIYQEIIDQGMEGSWDKYVPEKLLNRIFGFELLMAPYTIAHLKLGLLLKELGYKFDSNQRLGVYMTNTLSNAPSLQQAFAFGQTIAEEGHAANDVKYSKNVMVILGNPPYANRGMLNKNEWITQLLENYKEGLNEGKLNLDDDFIKFIRFGEWKINNSGIGILALITNNSYLDGVIHRRMREHLKDTFNKIYILNLHGNVSRREVSNDGIIDENIFDIQQGVAISIFIKDGKTINNSEVFYKSIIGTRKSKYDYLTNNDITSIEWNTLSNINKSSCLGNFYFFTPIGFNNIDEYCNYISFDEIFLYNQNGLTTDRDELFIDFDKNNLEQRMMKLLSPNGMSSDFINMYNVRDSSSYKINHRLISSNFEEQKLIKFLYRPFDKRWIYYDQKLTSRPAFQVMRHMINQNNIGMMTTRQVPGIDFGHILCSESMIEKKTCSHDRATYFAPLYLYPDTIHNEPTLFNHRQSNFSPSFIDKFTKNIHLTWKNDGKGDLENDFGPEDIFHYAYAVFHSSTYRERYAEFLKIDFPRLPLISNKELFSTLVQIGAYLVDLHLLRIPGADGIGGAGGATALLKPGKEGVSFPIRGTGKIEKISYHAPQNDQPGEIYINTTQKFTGIDRETWQMQIGGYQPLEKWLKDRKNYTLSTDDITYYLQMIIALRETRKLIRDIDIAIGEWPIQ